MAVNVSNPALRHQIEIDDCYFEDVRILMARKNRKSFKISTYFDMVLIQDCELMFAAIFHVKLKGSCLIATEYGSFNWFWTSTRKLVGFSPDRNSFKMIDTLKINKNQGVPLSDEHIPPEVKPELKPLSASPFLKPLKK